MEDTIGPEKTDQELDIPEDEAFIELTDIIENSAESEEAIIELTDVVDDDVEEEEEIIELTDIAAASLPESTEPLERIGEDEESEDTGAVEVEPDQPAEDGLMDTPPAVTSEQVDAAIERVVREMLSEKIESVMVQVIEKEVSKEIERLKGLLMDEQINED